MHRDLKGIVSIGLLVLSLLTAPRTTAQWTNPNPTGVVYVAVMATTGGVIVAPTRLTGDRLTMTELQLGSDLIDSWSDISALYGTYLTTANNMPFAVPTAPRGQITISKSGSGLWLNGVIKGVNGITVTNDSAGAVYVDGSLTGSVDAIFSAAGATNNGIMYVRRYLTPGTPIEPILFPASTNGYITWDGTNFTAVSALVGEATNAQQLAGYYANFFRDFHGLTNLHMLDDGVVQDNGDSRWLGFDFDSGLSVTIDTVTNGAMTGRVMRISSTLASTGACTTCSNEWTEANTWSEGARLRFGNVIVSVSGNGNANTGLSATVSIMGTNLQAGGAHSTVAGGRENDAHGHSATVAGGYGNTASGDSAAVGGGYGNTASGDNAAVGGGYANTAAGSSAVVAGGYLNAAAGLYSAVLGGSDNAANANYGAVLAGQDVDVTAPWSAAFGKFATVDRSNVVFLGWGANATNRSSATLGVHGLEVDGTIRATVGFQGDGSQLTNISGVTPTTFQTGNSTGAPTTVIFGSTTGMVSGSTLTVWPTNAGVGTGNGTFTQMVFGASSYTDAVIVVAGTGITLRTDGATNYIDNTLAGATNPVAERITAGATSAWWTAYEWGDHSTSGYYAASNPSNYQSGNQVETAATARAAIAAQSANATSVQGRAWSSEGPTNGAYPYWNEAQATWQFSTAPPASSTGSVSAVNGLVGAVTIAGGGGVTVSGQVINVAGDGAPSATAADKAAASNNTFLGINRFQTSSNGYVTIQEDEWITSDPDRIVTMMRIGATNKTGTSFYNSSQVDFVGAGGKTVGVIGGADENNSLASISMSPLGIGNYAGYIAAATNILNNTLDVPLVRLRATSASATFDVEAVANLSAKSFTATKSLLNVTLEQSTYAVGNNTKVVINTAAYPGAFIVSSTGTWSSLYTTLQNGQTVFGHSSSSAPSIPERVQITNGNLRVDGAILGTPDFGSIAMPGGLVLAVTTNYAAITNYTVSSLVGVTANLTSGTLTVPRDGYYQLNHGMSASSAGAAADFQFLMTSNGTEIATTRLHATLQNNAYEVGRTIWNTYLTNGTILGAAARVVSGTDTVTFTNYSINVVRLN